MKTVFATIIALFAILSTTAFADDVKRERVKFQAGASEATLKASIKGYDSYEYTLGAKAGTAISAETASTAAPCSSLRTVGLNMVGTPFTVGTWVYRTDRYRTHTV